MQVPAQTSENHLAKDSLMNDHESDSENVGKIEDTAKLGDESKIKKEPVDPAVPQPPRRKPGPKSRCLMEERPDGADLMLTADKMMNKELTLLHAPVILEENPQNATPSKPNTRSKQVSFLFIYIYHR